MTEREQRLERALRKIIRDAAPQSAWFVQIAKDALSETAPKGGPQSGDDPTSDQHIRALREIAAYRTESTTDPVLQRATLIEIARRALDDGRYVTVPRSSVRLEELR